MPRSGSSEIGRAPNDVALAPLALIPGRQVATFQRHLLVWYRAHKRALDWRETRDPYRIWISEIMLQQTRVAAVTPYYRRFLERFPTIRHLAKAPLELVLRYWAGLGYYSRSRNLQRAAKQVVAQHGGEFPKTLSEALALPGVGRYTAAAVLSIAFGEPIAALDGNVSRVLARLAAIRGDLRRPRQWRHLTEIASRLLARSAPGDWNQAMMELGATICTPRAPRCPECPVARWCRARLLGMAADLPASRRRKKTIPITLAAAVLLDPRGHTLLVRQSGDHAELFSRLWQFPSITGTRSARQKLSRHLQCALGVTAPDLRPLARSRHTVTFRRVKLVPFLVRVPELPAIDGASTPPLSDIGRLPISSATRKIAAAALAAI